MADRQIDKTRHWKSAIFSVEDNWDRLKNHIPAGWKVISKEEICPTTGEHHFQIHVDCGQQQRLSALCKWIRKTKWFPVVGETHIKNSIAYISKGETTAPGAVVETTFGEKYLRIHELLLSVARSVYVHNDIAPKIDDFYEMTKFLVRDDISWISKFSNPICKTLWKNYCYILLQKAAEEVQDGFFIIEEPEVPCVEPICNIILTPSIEDGSNVQRQEGTFSTQEEISTLCTTPPDGEEDCDWNE